MSRLQVALTGLIAAASVGCGARSPIPSLSNTIYDWQLPPVVRVETAPVRCPSTVSGRRITPPDPAAPVAMECVDRYARIVSDVLRQYERTEDPAVRAACADILSRLWQRGLLPGDIKHRLVDRYVDVAIAQIKLPRPGLEVRVTATPFFPFPPVIFTVRQMLYRNGRPERGLDPVSRGALLNRPTSRLAGLGTSVNRTGETYAFDIVLDEMVGNAVVWRKVLRTKWITVS